MAWGKVFKVALGNPADPFRATFVQDTAAPDSEAVDVSNLTVGFRVTRSNIFNDNRAEIKIANMSDATVSRFVNAESSYITIEAGYEDDGTAPIFNGFVTSVVAEWSGSDRYWNIIARPIRAKGYSEEENKGLSLDVVLGRERRKVFTNTYVTMAYAPGSYLIDMIRQYALQMGLALVVFNEAEVATFVRPNGYNYVGKAGGVVRNLRDFLRAEGYDLTVSMSEITVFKMYDTGSVLDIPALGYGSGLLKVGPVQNYETDPHQAEAFPPKTMWEIETLLIPKLAPNGVVQIKSDQLSGFFLVESVDFHGDNAEGPFNCTAIVSKQ